MISIAFSILTVLFVAWVCRFLWRARRDKELRKAAAAGMATSIGGASFSEGFGYWGSDGASYDGGGGDGGDGGGGD